LFIEQVLVNQCYKLRAVRIRQRATDRKNVVTARVVKLPVIYVGGKLPVTYR